MGANTNIEWCKHTFNIRWGCTKVSMACDFCYAEAFDHRLGGAHWGPHAPRRLLSDDYWREPLKWNAAAAKAGERHRVFSSSMADVFENVDDGQLPRLWDLIRLTPALDWLLLTKRPQNIARMLPPDWGAGWPNVWLGTSVENQTEADRRIPHLLAVPAAVRFLSCEPLLGPVRLVLTGLPGWDEDWKLCALTGQEWAGRGFDQDAPLMEPRIHWVIVGGESGPGARPMHPDWARALRDQCVAAGVPFFFKQWGEWAPQHLEPKVLVPSGEFGTISLRDQTTARWAGLGQGGSLLMRKIGKKAAGRMLDADLWDQMPGGAT